ncbi:MAG: SDR family oxidoreductase, partial [Nitrososphaeraceae archaeon]
SIMSNIRSYNTTKDMNRKVTLFKHVKKYERKKLKTIRLDVNDDSSVKEAIETIVKENNRIDVLVNNAGYGLFGSLEELSIKEIREQFETNFFGVVRATKAVIPTMRKQGNGTIVNISSTGGRIGLVPFNTSYHASKFALEGFTESLRQELVEFGINIILIEPGTIGTNFMNNIRTAKNYNPDNSPYAKTIKRMFEGSVPIMANSSHPREVAQVILNAVNSSSPNVRYSAGKDAEVVLKKRSELSDREMEEWTRESWFDKKGFIRQ